MLSLFITYNLIVSDLVLLSLFFSLITLITIIIFLRGQTKEPDSQTMHSLVSVGIKFLLDLVLALLWFIVIKKTVLPSILIFFVIYLTFTLFSTWIILRTLKDKSL
jgi:hypothetical protein